MLNLDSVRKILFWTFLAIFIATATAAIAAFLKAHGFIGATYTGDTSLIQWLMGAVVVEVCVLMFGLWKGLFSNIQESHDAPREENKPAAVDLSPTIIEMTIVQALTGDLNKAAEWGREIRERFPEVVSSELRFLEAVIRGLLGHGHFMRDELYRGLNRTQISIMEYEYELLRYADNARVENPKKLLREIELDNRSARLWYGLISIQMIELGRIREARHYFDQIDHNLSRGVPVLTESDNFIAYSALTIGIVAAALEEDEISEKYFDIARNIPRNIDRIQPDVYPFVVFVGKLHCAFVNQMLGFDQHLSKEYLKGITGHARVIARHCKVMAHSDTALNTVVKMSNGWSEKRRLKRSAVRKNLFKLQRDLVSSANPVHLASTSNPMATSAKLASHQT